MKTGGFTGSGTRTFLNFKVRGDYTDCIMETSSMITSPQISDTVVEPYNAALSFPLLVKNTDECFILEIEAIYDIRFRPRS